MKKHLRRMPSQFSEYRMQGYWFCRFWYYTCTANTTFELLLFGGYVIYIMDDDKIVPVELCSDVSNKFLAGQVIYCWIFKIKYPLSHVVGKCATLCGKYKLRYFNCKSSGQPNSLICVNWKMGNYLWFAIELELSVSVN